MTKYEPIEFTKLSEAIAYLEDGGELYEYCHASNDYFGLSTAELLSKWHQSLLAKPKPAPWYEKLDGTVENGVLCRSDVTGVVFLCIKAYADNYYDDQDNRMGKNITPLTCTEIQKLMDNAPDEWEKNQCK